MKAILRYLGGKWRASGRIIDLFPAHRVYVEPYGGSAAILLNKAPSAFEIYNDLDDEIVNLFEILRSGQSGALSDAVRLTPYSRTELENAIPGHPDKVERARRLLVRSMMGIASDCSRYTTTGYRISSDRYPTCAMDWATMPDRLTVAAERLKQVHIEHRDALDVMTAHDSPDTLHYVDPPYMMETRTRTGRYAHEYTDYDHSRLLSTLRQMRGMVVLSGYDSDLYRDTLQGWHRVSYGERTNMGRARQEVLWLNYQHQPMLF